MIAGGRFKSGCSSKGLDLIAVRYSASSPSFSRSFNLLHSLSEAVVPVTILRPNTVAKSVSDGLRITRDHLAKQMDTISSSDRWMVPSALLGPDLSCLKPLADRSTNSDRVTFLVNGNFVPSLMPPSPPPPPPPPTPPRTEDVADDDADKSRVSFTISAPLKVVPEKALSAASSASSTLISPSSSSSAISNELLSSANDIIPDF
mmetsp:Transcript_26232/g.61299  ORF Transcript_26232/g.61299 Transcript_26232/m.61299 type:complete len:204 (-) Transcript_26232:2237-2848(-)